MFFFFTPARKLFLQLNSKWIAWLAFRGNTAQNKSKNRRMKRRRRKRGGKRARIFKQSDPKTIKCVHCTTHRERRASEETSDSDPQAHTWGTGWESSPTLRCEWSFFSLSFFFLLWIKGTMLQPSPCRQRKTKVLQTWVGLPYWSTPSILILSLPLLMLIQSLSVNNTESLPSPQLLRNADDTSSGDRKKPVGSLTNNISSKKSKKIIKNRNSMRFWA